jgi:hypothetical protein
MEAKEVLLERLSKIVKELITVCRALPDPNVAIYVGWSAKDTPRHITSVSRHHA